jgi:hypothetical protein
LKIAQRFLEGVAPENKDNESVLSEEHEKIRIVLACRSRQKAEIAVSTLRKCFPNRTLLLDIEHLELCNMRNIEDFCRRFLER